MMHKGWKLRRVVTVERSDRYSTAAIADCGHLVVRGHLVIGQRVFCGTCLDTRGPQE